MLVAQVAIFLQRLVNDLFELRSGVRFIRTGGSGRAFKYRVEDECRDKRRAVIKFFPKKKRSARLGAAGRS
jgi:hypothetical protein